MTESFSEEQQSVPLESRQVLAPITFQFDPAQLLETMWPNLAYTGDPDVEVPEPFYGVKEEIVRQLVHRLEQRIGKTLDKAVQQAAIESAKARIEPLIEKVFTDPFPLTNSYGERTGKEATIREMVIDRVKEVLNEKYSTSGNRASSYDRDTKSLVDIKVDQAVKAALEKDLRVAAAEVVAEFKTKLTAGISQGLAEQVTKVLVSKL